MREGALGRYGFYEAIDYTPERLPQTEKRAVIRAFMAHHQGMSLVALDNLLNRDVMQRRFHAEPLVQATELLLQERVPRGVAAAHPRAEEVLSGRLVRTLTGLVSRSYDTPDLADAAHATALERHVLGDGDDGRRRLLALRAFGRHALARGRRRATATARSVTCATSGAAPSGQPVISRRRSSRALTKSPSRKTRLTSGARTRASRRTPRSSSRPKTTPRFGRSR